MRMRIKIKIAYLIRTGQNLVRLRERERERIKASSLCNSYERRDLSRELQLLVVIVGQLK